MTQMRKCYTIERISKSTAVECVCVGGGGGFGVFRRRFSGEKCPTITVASF